MSETEQKSVEKDQLANSGPNSPGGDSRSVGDGPAGEEELDSKTLHIQSKRFYLDVKQNRRGRFIKIAEVGAGGRKSRLLLMMSTAVEFRDQLTDFVAFCEELGPHNAEEVSEEEGKLKSSSIQSGFRRYYFDLKENQRGRFLRVSQTLPRGGPRSQIAIPAQGLAELRDTLSDLLETYGTDDYLNDSAEDLPESRSIRVANKTFYFDVGHNNRGTYLRISEVRSSIRTAITVPESAWSQIRDILHDFVEQRAGEDSDVKSEVKENGHADEEGN